MTSALNGDTSLPLVGETVSFVRDSVRSFSTSAYFEHIRDLYSAHFAGIVAHLLAAFDRRTARARALDARALEQMKFDETCNLLEVATMIRAC